MTVTVFDCFAAYVSTHQWSVNGSDYLIYRQVNSPDSGAICVMTSSIEVTTDVISPQASSKESPGGRQQLSLVKLDSNCNQMETTKYLQMEYHGKATGYY